MNPDGARAYAGRMTEAAVEAIAGYRGSETLCELARYLPERKN